MRSRIIAFAAVLALAAPLSFAQGRGQGGGAQKGQGAGQAQGQQKGRGGPEMGKGKMDRDRIRATDQQRDQLRTCDQAMDRVRQRARDMAKMGTGAKFNAEQARQQHSQLRNELRAMEQEHERLMNGLSEGQKKAMEERHRNMEQIHSRIENRMQEMNQNLGQSTPDGKHFTERARALEQDMKLFQKQHRAMQNEMGARP